MKQTTRRILLWLGVALILLPTAFVAFTLFQPREYQSSVFIEVGHPLQQQLAPLIDRDTFYAILFLIGIYLPGGVLVFISWRSWRRGRRLNGTPTI